MRNEPNTITYKVVSNHEEQYSIWWVERTLPAGWFDVGFIGTKEECLNYINEIWKDMRPRSVREQLRYC